eukprot:403374061
MHCLLNSVANQTIHKMIKRQTFMFLNSLSVGENTISKQSKQRPPKQCARLLAHENQRYLILRVNDAKVVKEIDLECEPSEEPTSGQCRVFIENDFAGEAQIYNFDRPQSQYNSNLYNRKEKSLGELCRRFLFLYGRESQDLLYLDQCTRELAVERRRIYDIINILESFNVIRRKAKNAYQWKGIERIVVSIEHQIAQIQAPNQKSCITNSATVDKSKSSTNFNTSKVKVKKNNDSFLNELTTKTSSYLNYDSDKDSCLEMPQKQLAYDDDDGKYKKDKSLGILCQQFIALFLTWRNVISLEEAARQISKKDIEEQKLKTKIRRLYDIANVLQSIGLIEKTNYPQSKKPAFQWIGLDGVREFVRELKAFNASKPSINRKTELIEQERVLQQKPRDLKITKQKSLQTVLGKRLHSDLNVTLEMTSPNLSCSTNLGSTNDLHESFDYARSQKRVNTQKSRLSSSSQIQEYISLSDPAQILNDTDLTPVQIQEQHLNVLRPIQNFSQLISHAKMNSRISSSRDQENISLYHDKFFTSQETQKLNLKINEGQNPKNSSVQINNTQQINTIQETSQLQRPQVSLLNKSLSEMLAERVSQHSDIDPEFLINIQNLKRNEYLNSQQCYLTKLTYVNYNNDCQQQASYPQMKKMKGIQMLLAAIDAMVRTQDQNMENNQ